MLHLAYKDTYFIHTPLTRSLSTITDQLKNVWSNFTWNSLQWSRMKKKSKTKQTIDTKYSFISILKWFFSIYAFIIRAIFFFSFSFHNCRTDDIYKMNILHSNCHTHTYHYIYAPHVYSITRNIGALAHMEYGITTSHYKIVVVCSGLMIVPEAAIVTFIMKLTGIIAVVQLTIEIIRSTSWVN